MGAQSFLMVRKMPEAAKAASSPRKTPVRKSPVKEATSAKKTDNNVLGRQALADLLAARSGIDKKAAANQFNDLFSIFEEEIRAGKTLRITGFGTFKKQTRAARMFTNPYTKATFSAPEREVL